MAQDRNTKSRSWAFTWNDYPEGWKEICRGFKQYVVQEETGANGNKHLQGCCRFENAISFNSIKDKLPGAHIEVCKNWNASKNYCSKDETRTGERISDTLDTGVRDPMENKDFRWWQEEILNILKEEPDERKIHWYWEEKGGVGKTTFCKHLCIKHGAVYVSGKSADIKYAIASMKVKPKVVIWDVPRTQKDYMSYEALESIKNGIFFSTKFESGMCLFNIPHVIVFANFRPEYDKISLDRWHCVDIEQVEAAHGYD